MLAPNGWTFRKVEMIPEEERTGHADMLIKLSKCKDSACCAAPASEFLSSVKHDFKTTTEYSRHQFVLFSFLLSDWKTSEDASSGSSQTPDSAESLLYIVAPRLEGVFDDALMPLSPIKAVCYSNSPQAQRNHLLSTLWWGQERDNPPPLHVVRAPGSNERWSDQGQQRSSCFTYFGTFGQHCAPQSN